MSSPADRYKHFLETLSPDRLSDLDSVVTADVHFKDPFNDVRGVEAMRDVFAHMYRELGELRFQVRRLQGNSDECLMEWRFDATLRGKPWHFYGMSVLEFAADGRVCSHIDHWDAAGAFYERLPLIGWLLSRIRRKIGVRHR